jgi:hypothetical protein
MGFPAWLLILYVIVLLVGLLAPLDFYTANGVRWALDGTAVVFVSPGILRSHGSAARLHADLTSGSGLTVEVRAASHATDQVGPARIVSYSADTASRNFMLHRTAQRSSSDCGRRRAATTACRNSRFPTCSNQARGAISS